MIERKRSVAWTGLSVFAAAVLLAAPASFAKVEQHSDKSLGKPAGIGDEPFRRPQQSADLRKTAGEIAAVDLAMGRLTLREIEAGRTTETHDYLLNPRDTAVTDPLDKQFLKLEDLQPGYLVRVEYAEVDGKRLAKTITVDSVNDLRWAVGTVTQVDPRRKSVTIAQTQPSPTASPARTQYEVTNQTQVMDLADRRFIALDDLEPGDTVQVEYTLKDGKRVARLISELDGPELPGPAVIWSAGRIEAVDLDSGVLVVSEQIPNWNYSERVNYVVDLDDTRIVDLRGRRFLSLDDLKPGQPVRLQFVELQGGRLAVQCVVLKP